MFKEIFHIKSVGNRPIMPGTKQGQAGTKQGQAGIKQGQHGQNRDSTDITGTCRYKTGTAMHKAWRTKVHE